MEALVGKTKDASGVLEEIIRITIINLIYGYQGGREEEDKDV
jgi:hypothetical protein